MLRNINLKKILKYLPEKTAANAERSIYNNAIQTCEKHNIDVSWESEIFTHVYVLI